MQKRTLVINKEDNAVVALTDLSRGERMATGGGEVILQEDIQAKHKFLLTDLKKGDHVIMYGVPVGTVNDDLKRGALLTTKNLTHFADTPSLDKRSGHHWIAPDVSKWSDRTFNGYHRSDGKVGTANYWLFVPLVFCENRNLKIIEEALTKGLGYYRPNEYEAFVRNQILDDSEVTSSFKSEKVFPNIDGIKFLYHHGGCGGTRGDAETLLRLLSGYVSHPNVAGATILSLGCQNAQMSWFQQIQKEQYPQSDKPIIYLEQQQIKSENQLIKTAIHQTIEAMKEANSIERKPAGLDKLVIGLECGGSDGFSGISANPAVGQVSDLVNTLGGATILSEFPELNGVEQNIIDRAVDEQTAKKFMDIQHAYSEKAKSVGSGFDMNPSPGNIKDGLITDAIKSAGAAKKGGSAPIVDVLDYTEPLTKAGLNLLCTPGNDVESTTGLAGSGANVILFTTGLGTPTGNPITPVIKLSSNTRLFEEMNDIIDINTGKIISGESSLEETGNEILEKIIAVASGEETKAMQLEQNDFIPWKRGVSL